MSAAQDDAASGRRGRSGGLLRLLRHTSNYSAGTLLITLASIISFPVFTRTFTVAEYGDLSLINATLGLLVGVGKLGLQKSVVRFHAEIESGKRAGDRRGLYSTVLFGMLMVGGAVGALSALAFVAMPSRWWGHDSLRYLLAAISPLVLVRVVDSAMLNLLRAEQRSGFYSLYTVLRKYLGLGLVLLVLFSVARNLWGFYMATLAGETLALGLLVAHYARQRLFRPADFSGTLFISMLAYGLPLLVSELSSLVLNLGGRYIIDFQLGAEALGAYSAAYNFCDYLQSALTGAFAQAVVPMYLRMWEGQGRQRTEAFLQQALRYYLMLALPLIAGMAAVAPGLLRLLASDRYAVAAPLFVYIVGSMLVAGGTPIFSAGIYINKLTKVVMYSVLATAAVNLVLTAVLTRSMGIEGAALAMLCTRTLYVAMTVYYGRGTVALRMPWADLCRFGAMSLLMYEVVTRALPWSGLLHTAGQIVVGVALYGALLLQGDRELRLAAARAWQARPWRSRPPGSRG